MKLLLFLIPLVLRLVWDWYKIRIRKEAITKKGYLIRNIAMVGLIAVVSAIDFFLLGTSDRPWWVTPLYPLGIWVLLFDYTINLLIGRKWYYKSTTNNSTWDKLRNLLPLEVELAVRLWLAAGLIGTYYNYYLL